MNVTGTRLAAAFSCENKPILPAQPLAARACFLPVTRGSWSRQTKGELRVQMDYSVVAVTLYPSVQGKPLPPPQKGSHEGGAATTELVSTARETIHVALPVRPSECTVGALCEKLFGVWHSRAVVDLRTKNMTEKSSWPAGSIQGCCSAQRLAALHIFLALDTLPSSVHSYHHMRCCGARVKICAAPQKCSTCDARNTQYAFETDRH